MLWIQIDGSELIYLQWSWLWLAEHSLLPVPQEADPILDRTSAEDRHARSTGYRRGTNEASCWLMPDRGETLRRLHAYPGKT